MFNLSFDTREKRNKTKDQLFKKYPRLIATGIRLLGDQCEVQSSGLDQLQPDPSVKDNRPRVFMGIVSAIKEADLWFKEEKKTFKRPKWDNSWKGKKDSYDNHNTANNQGQSDDPFTTGSEPLTFGGSTIPQQFNSSPEWAANNGWGGDWNNNNANLGNQNQAENVNYIGGNQGPSLNDDGKTVEANKGEDETKKTIPPMTLAEIQLSPVSEEEIRLTAVGNALRLYMRAQKEASDKLKNDFTRLSNVGVVITPLNDTAKFLDATQVTIVNIMTEQIRDLETKAKQAIIDRNPLTGGSASSSHQG